MNTCAVISPNLFLFFKGTVYSRGFSILKYFECLPEKDADFLQGLLKMATQNDYSKWLLKMKFISHTYQAKLGII